MRHSTPDVREAQLRLGIPGLVAELFDKRHAEHPVESEAHLFDEEGDLLKAPQMRVGLSKTAAGGLNFST